MIKPLDIVETPKGGIAIVKECSPKSSNLPINKYSVRFIKNPNNEHNAWYHEKELKLLKSLPILLAECMCHPFGDNEQYLENIFNNQLKLI